ncbi:MAG: hypothetical protein JWO19_3990, partial [Bryobacterales bacterium]|nr:hypothetical protein [Bryobacterales bacterium]
MRIGRCSALMIFWAMLVGVLPIP